MKVYICGPITGMEGYREKFSKAEKRLRDLGYEYIVNPVTECDRNLQEEASWEDCMSLCMRLLSGCDAIAMLPGWSESHGASTEFHFAMGVGKEVIYLN